jgi:hypothetical protein
MTIIGLILAFTLVYPKLCGLAGFNPNSADALDEIARKFAGTRPTPLRVVQALLILFLACGPGVTMLLSLLFVTWMFTFSEFDPKTKDPMTFPARLFTLPVSTPFLFWSLMLGGMAAVVVLYESWVHLVRLPHIDIFAAYLNCFDWMTVLAVAQGIMWSLAGWPITRTLLLSAVLFGFMCSPAWRDIFESPIVMPPLFVLGAVMAHAGLQKMRHGQWQGLPFKWPLAVRAARANLRGPKRFASPATAQLWFEWRRFARHLCFYVAVLALVPVAIHVLVRFLAGLGQLQNETLSGFILCLIAIPLLLHLCFAISPPQRDLPFVMIRPLTNGEMTMATLKAAGISTVISWMLVLAALCALPLLGDFAAAEQGIPVAPQWRTIDLLGLVLLTWRLIAVNLCFTLSGNRRLAALPTLMLLGLWLGGIILSWLAVFYGYWDSFWRLVPGLLFCLIALKFLLAFLAFQVSLKRNLLSHSALRTYLVVWILLVAGLLIPTVILFHDQEWIVPLSLGIVLLMPLARIGFCPITLGWNRHM